MTTCCLFQKNVVTISDIRTLTTVKKYKESSHLDHFLKKCPNCGAFLYYEFYEYVDFSGGDDQCYCTYVHVENEIAADKLYDKCASNGHSYIRRIKPAIHWQPDNTINILK